MTARPVFGDEPWFEPYDRKQPHKAAKLKYMSSPAWEARREAALKRAAYRCQVCCFDKRLEVHHRTYRNLGDEPDCDLTVLCWRCHALFHAFDRLRRHAE